MDFAMSIEATVVAAVCAAMWLLYRKFDEEETQTAAIIGNLSMEVLHLRELVTELQEKAETAQRTIGTLTNKLAEYEKAYGTAEQFNATINTELEKQARLEKEWTEGINNILAYSVKTGVRNDNE